MTLHNAAAEDAPADPIVDRDPEYIGRRLFARRTVLVFGEITTSLASRVTAELLALDAAEGSPIRVLVHSPGGHVEAADTMHDVVRSLRAPVEMLGTGWVASAAATLFIAVPRERRLALPNTRFLLHQPLGGVRGRASEIDREVEQIVRIRSRLHRMVADATGRELSSVAADMERDHWMSADEAIAYGLVGKIVTHVG